MLSMLSQISLSSRHGKWYLFDVFEKPIQHVFVSFLSTFNCKTIINRPANSPSMSNTGKNLHKAVNLKTSTHGQLTFGWYVYCFFSYYFDFKFVYSNLFTTSISIQTWAKFLKYGMEAIQFFLFFPSFLCKGRWYHIKFDYNWIIIQCKKQFVKILTRRRDLPQKFEIKFPHIV